MTFKGAKLALFLGPELLVILRDDKMDIPFPGHWDLPGGGREAGESPAECALRETAEEVGLHLSEADLGYGRCYPRPDGDSWFFAAHIAVRRVDEVQLGDEGQRWALMSPQVYCAHPLGIPQFKQRLRDYLEPQDALR
jgi:8-oxo-dGTP diphosphatase